MLIDCGEYYEDWDEQRFLQWAEDSDMHYAVKKLFHSFPPVVKAVLESSDVTELIPFTDRLLGLHHQGNSPHDLFGSWQIIGSDFFLLVGRYKEALLFYPELNCESCWGHRADQVLSLRLALAEEATAREIIILYGPQVTIWGKEHLDDVVRHLDLRKTHGSRADRMVDLQEWAKHCGQAQYNIWFTDFERFSPIPCYWFSRSRYVQDSVNAVTREAENAAREELGIPRVGEGWIAETQLYDSIKGRFPTLKVIHHASTSWLKPQHLDIFMPEINVGIEYQGEQHDKPIRFFGGVDSLQRTKARDAKKLRLCRQHGVNLVYVKPGYVLEEVIEQIKSSEHTG